MRELLLLIFLFISIVICTGESSSSGIKRKSAESEGDQGRSKVQRAEPPRLESIQRLVTSVRSTESLGQTLSELNELRVLVVDMESAAMALNNFGGFEGFLKVAKRLEGNEEFVLNMVLLFRDLAQHARVDSTKRINIVTLARFFNVHRSNTEVLTGLFEAFTTLVRTDIEYAMDIVRRVPIKDMKNLITSSESESVTRSALHFIVSSLSDNSAVSEVLADFPVKELVECIKKIPETDVVRDLSKALLSAALSPRWQLQVIKSFTFDYLIEMHQEDLETIQKVFSRVNDAQLNDALVQKLSIASMVEFINQFEKNEQLVDKLTSSLLLRMEDGSSNCEQVKDLKHYRILQLYQNCESIVNSILHLSEMCVRNVPSEVLHDLVLKYQGVPSIVHAAINIRLSQSNPDHSLMLFLWFAHQDIVSLYQRYIDVPLILLSKARKLVESGPNGGSFVVNALPISKIDSFIHFYNKDQTLVLRGLDVLLSIAKESPEHHAAIIEHLAFDRIVETHAKDKEILYTLVSIAMSVTQSAQTLPNLLNDASLRQTALFILENIAEEDLVFDFIAFLSRMAELNPQRHSAILEALPIRKMAILISSLNHSRRIVGIFRLLNQLVSKNPDIASAVAKLIPVKYVLSLMDEIQETDMTQQGMQVLASVTKVYSITADTKDLSEVLQLILQFRQNREVVLNGLIVLKYLKSEPSLKYNELIVAAVELIQQYEKDNRVILAGLRFLDGVAAGSPVAVIFKNFPIEKLFSLLHFTDNIAIIETGLSLIHKVILDRAKSGEKNRKALFSEAQVTLISENTNKFILVYTGHVQIVASALSILETILVYGQAESAQALYQRLSVKGLSLLINRYEWNESVVSMALNLMSGVLGYNETFGLSRFLGEEDLNYFAGKPQFRREASSLLRILNSRE